MERRAPADTVKQGGSRRAMAKHDGLQLMATRRRAAAMTVRRAPAGTLNHGNACQLITTGRRWTATAATRGRP